jgi:hypothetical protein
MYGGVTGKAGDRLPMSIRCRAEARLGETSKTAPRFYSLLPVYSCTGEFVATRDGEVFTNGTAADSL